MGGGYTGGVHREYTRSTQGVNRGGKQGNYTGRGVVHRNYRGSTYGVHRASAHGVHRDITTEPPKCTCNECTESTTAVQGEKTRI